MYTPKQAFISCLIRCLTLETTLRAWKMSSPFLAMTDFGLRPSATSWRFRLHDSPARQMFSSGGGGPSDVVPKVSGLLPPPPRHAPPRPPPARREGGDINIARGGSGPGRRGGIDWYRSEADLLTSIGARGTDGPLNTWGDERTEEPGQLPISSGN